VASSEEVVGIGITGATAHSVTAQPSSGATTPSLEMHSLRNGSQAYYWTAVWQERERLADFDFLIGGDAVYRPADVADLLGWLHKDE
jgi:hypothetical protein